MASAATSAEVPDDTASDDSDADDDEEGEWEALTSHVDPATGATYYTNSKGEATWAPAPAPEACGWEARADPDSGVTYFCRADTPPMNRGDAAAATRIFRVETSRGDAVAATWIVRGDESRRRRGCHVDIPWRRLAELGPAQVLLPRGHGGDAVGAACGLRLALGGPDGPRVRRDLLLPRPDARVQVGDAARRRVGRGAR